MATRTQKAAMKKKAEATKARPQTGKAGRGAAKAKGAPARKGAKPPSTPSLPEPERVSFMERVWHRIGDRAQRKQAVAHQHEAEREEAERQAARQAAQEARDIERHHAAEERRKSAAAAREMKRIAIEEEARLKEEARQAVLAQEEAARAAAAAKKEAALEARRAKAAAARQAKQDAERQAAEKAAARKAARAAKKQAEAAEAATPASPAPVADDEPVVELIELESEEDGADAVPATGRTSPPRTDAEAQADRFAAEMAARRSKPIHIEDEEVHDAIPKLPVGRRGAAAPEAKQVLVVDPAPPARIDTAPRGLSVPEQYLLLTMDDSWDERRERAKPGALGGALVGALVLELALHGKVRVQRDRFQVTDAAVDEAAGAVAAKLARWSDLPSLQAMKELAKWVPQLLPAYKDRMASRGLLEHRAWRHLGLLYRSQTALLDAEAQERLRNKLGRAIAGGGRPDAPTILALGLLEASGLFGLVVPEGAQQYNRKRLNGLLAGKDVMGYKVDDELKGMQEIAVRTVLDNVRVLTQA